MATICPVYPGDRSFSSFVHPSLTVSAPVIPHPVFKAYLLLTLTSKVFPHSQILELVSV